MNNYYQILLDNDTILGQFLLKLTEVTHLIIPRNVLTENIQKLKLYRFTDDSGKTYGVAIYIRCLFTTG